MAEGGVVKLEATPIQHGGANQAPTVESDIIRRSIVYIETPEMIGTGSIVKFGDNSYLMTCNHVIPTEEMARKTSIIFDKILQTGDKKPKNKGMEVEGKKLFSFNSDRWFLTSSKDEFDVTLIAIKMNKVRKLSKFKERRQLDLSEYKEHLPEYSLKVNDGVKIWHYPENDKFRRNESFYTVNSVSGHLFTHSAGTDHGSSGAPVFKICKGKEVAKEVVVGLHRGSLKNNSNPPDLNLATRIQAIRCMLSNKEQALEDVVWDVLLCQKGSSKEGSSEAPAKSESSDQDQQTMPPSTTPVEDQRTLALSKVEQTAPQFDSVERPRVMLVNFNDAYNDNDKKETITGGYLDVKDDVILEIKSLVRACEKFYIGITSAGETGLRCRWNQTHRGNGMTRIAWVYATSSDTFCRGMQDVLIKELRQWDSQRERITNSRHGGSRQNLNDDDLVVYVVWKRNYSGYSK